MRETFKINTEPACEITKTAIALVNALAEIEKPGDRFCAIMSSFKRVIRTSCSCGCQSKPRKTRKKYAKAGVSE